MSKAYYNEIDPYAAQWLRNLIAAGHIAPGDVDERSIVDVRAADLAGYSQCHFFAGIGVWSYALRLAGWPDDEEVWSGSCPCQPFSAAGEGAEFDDARHLWPAWRNLIGERRPCAVVGEQVAAKVGLAWLDIVHADLEAAGYTVGAVDTCAAGFGAPHIRQRFYFVADTENADRRPGERRAQAGTGSHGERRRGPAGGGTAGAGEPHGVVHAEREGLEGHGWHGDDRDQPGRIHEGTPRPTTAAGGPCNGFWSDAEWIACIDKKARPVEPGTFPLAHGAPARVGRLRAYGNAINARQAAEFIRAYDELLR